MKYVETGARRNGKTTRAWALLRNAVNNYKHVVIVGYNSQLAEFYISRLRQSGLSLDGIHSISAKSFNDEMLSKIRSFGIIDKNKVLYLFDEVSLSNTDVPQAIDEEFAAKVLAYHGIENYIFVSYNKWKWQYSIDDQERIVIEQVSLPNASGYETECGARKAGVAELTRRLIQTKTKFEQLSKSVEAEMTKIVD